MSKRVIRVFVAALISLGIIAVAAPGVQARLENALRKPAAKNAAFVVLDVRSTEKGNLHRGDSYGDGGRDCGSADSSVDY